MPDPTMLAVVMSDRHETRIRLEHFAPVMGEGRVITRPGVLTIVSEPDPPTGRPAVSVRVASSSLDPDTGRPADHLVWDNFTVPKGDPMHLHALPDVVRSVVLAYRPDLTEQVRP